MVSKKLFCIVLGAMALSMVGCKSKFDKLNDSGQADPNKWYTRRATVCGDRSAAPGSANGLRPGCNYTSVGHKITMEEDPAYTTVPINQWTRQVETYTYERYNSTTGTWEYYTETEVLFTSPTTGLKFRASDSYCVNEAPKAVSSSNDEIAAAQADVADTQKLQAQQLVAKYGMSVDAAASVAQKVNKLAAAGFDPQASKDDAAIYVAAITGIDKKEALKSIDAAAAGDESALDKAIDSAASSYNLNAKAIRNIIQSELNQ